MGLSPVRLEGERVVVRSSAEGDARRFLDYFDRNRAHLEPWEPDHAAEFYTLAYWETRMREHAEERTRGTLERMCIFDKPDEERIAGMISLTEIIARAPVWRARVGYSLDAQKEGRGLMSEALKVVIAYAFERLNLKRIQAGYLPHNARSARVLEKAGFVREGYHRDYFFVGGAWHDHIETSLINPAWKVPLI
jgi:ribosomal-protein-alanine N-acetyltransferase